MRPIGVVLQVQSDSLTLRTDAGPELLVRLADNTTVWRVPPGAKDLKSASKVAASEIKPGDRIMARGRVSDDQKSVLATSIILMARADLASAREAERLDWQRRGIAGVVKAIDPATKGITIAVPNTPPMPGNPTHPVVLALAPGAAVLRYAPDSVKFSDAKPSAVDAVQVGDQVRALGTKSEDGSRYTVEKLVFGTFRNIGATVISVDAKDDSLVVKDLASGKPVLVRTNADSKLHRLPPFIAQMIATFNAGAAPGNGGAGAEAHAIEVRAAGGPRGGAGGADRWQRGGAGGPGGGSHDFQQALDNTPPLSLAELKPGEALIVVSTEGAKPGEVTAIAVLGGVEPILSARAKNSQDVVLGPWNMSMGGGEGGG